MERENTGSEHRDTYLLYCRAAADREIETEVRDVDKIRITKVNIRLLSRATFWGVIRVLQSNINICYPPQLSAPHF